MESDASGPAGGTDSIIYKNKPKYAYLYSQLLAKGDFSNKNEKEEL